jgi:3-methyladenine DNA glycosylase AlkD
MSERGGAALVKPKVARSSAQLKRETAAAVAALKRHATKATLDGMARYGLPAKNALGVPVGKIQLVAKSLGRDHELAGALWKTGIYEARLLVAFIGDPARLTPAEMERWCRDFDNWGVVDTLCFKLFDQSPHAWKKVEPWTKLPDEFGRRAGYVLIACLAAHNESAGDEKFLRLLSLIERGAADERNFVKKGVSWALRMVGRRSHALNLAAVTVAQRLAASAQPAARWIGKGALKELTSPAVKKRFGAKR